jgi:hypothetical protein
MKPCPPARAAAVVVMRAISSANPVVFEASGHHGYKRRGRKSRRM